MGGGRFPPVPDFSRCQPLQRPEQDEATIRFPVSSSLPPPPLSPPLESFWLDRWRPVLRGRVSMLATGVVLGILLFLVVRAPLGSSQAGTPPPPPIERSKPYDRPLPMLEPSRPASVDPAPAAAPVASVAPSAQATLPREKKARTAGTSRRHASSSCDPPYRYDRDGIKRIKLRCL
jgi:hypothetical protein